MKFSANVTAKHDMCVYIYIVYICMHVCVCVCVLHIYETISRSLMVNLHMCVFVAFISEDRLCGLTWQLCFPLRLPFLCFLPSAYYLPRI